MLNTISNRLNTLLLCLLVLMTGAVIAILATRANGGPLDPTGAPASTGKTQILSLPFTVASSGSYILNSNLAGLGGSDGITVAADDVTIDLNGFTLVGTGGVGTGILNSSGKNLALRNGTIRDWGSGGVFSNGLNTTLDGLRISHSGLTAGANGVYLTGDSGLVTNCVISGSGGSGGSALVVYYGNVSDCVVNGNTGAIGIRVSASVIQRCTVNANASFGVELSIGSQLIDSTVSWNGNGVGVDTFGNRIAGNTVAKNTGVGIHIALAAGNRVEDNNFVLNGTGIEADAGGNVIIKNSLNGNTTPYSIAAGNTVGDNTNVAGTVPASAWANLNY
jgi:parallel beta-helix repeat protein